ncbi:MAG: aspartate--tRNA ligase [Patescibacteria group bacterium]|nr:aspartate--tRNA ligase [Patescibacteria group bacterium]
MKEIFIDQTLDLIGQKVVLYGFIETVRNHGKIIFFDLRDRSGVLQTVIAESSPFFEQTKSIRPETVVKIEGEVKERPDRLKNPELKTGAIELEISKLEILSQAQTPPFDLNDDGKKINEETRLKYRYLDLRRTRLQKNLIVRHQTNQFIRNFLSDKNFIEIETPILTKSTPEGARDYLVPSRLYQGKFYALPQSPQQYKQLLMVAGFERYFQISRCFRDEDPRGDRQPEFSQLDIEISYIERDEILNLVEELIVALVKKIFPKKKFLALPFPRLNYGEVMAKYQSDKPDLRQNRNDPDELAFAFVIDFPMFEWKEEEKRWDAVHHPFTQPKLADGSKNKEKLIETLKKNPQSLLSEQFDLVCNGYEVGGGSLRTTDADVLIETFKAMGNDQKEIEEKFGHLIQAFSFGVPPHGGIAPGLDRLLMILQNESSIREVIAFPKTGEGRDLMMDSPSAIEPTQLKELHLKIETKEKK